MAMSVRAPTHNRSDIARNGQDAVVRKYTANSGWEKQWFKMRMYPGRVRNLRNIVGKCLDVHGGSNTHKRHVIWWACHNGANQGWYIDRVAYKYPKYPLANGIKFQIKSRMPGNRALFFHEKYGKNQFRLRIRDNNPENNRQWWTFDDRTKTIRAWSKRNQVIANQRGQGFRIGKAAVVRTWGKEQGQRISWYGGAVRNIRNNGKKCLDVWGGKNKHYQHITWWNCHNGLNQAWYIDQKGIEYPKQPLKDGVKFQIRSRMATNRALFWSEHIGGNQFRLRIRNNLPGEGRQWFVFDKRTRTIRASEKRKFVIAN